MSHWRTVEQRDHALASTGVLDRREARAIRDISDFAQEPCYAGVSWGKDSVVVAHLVRKVLPDLPLVWVRVEPIKNPDCETVRDCFLAQHPGPYDEIEVWCRGDADGWHARGTLEKGFAEAAKRYGARHISGVRGEESSARKMRGKTFGISTATTCAPLQWWSGQDVFAYLAHYDLPVHPAYAMSFGGRYDRIQIRVASLGGKRGTGRDREQWEQRYYSTELELCERKLRAKDQ